MAEMNRTHELAMLYLSKQDLSGKAPKDIVEMYKDAVEKIQQAFRDTASKAQRITY